VKRVRRTWWPLHYGNQLKKFFVVSVGSSISRSPHHSNVSTIAGNSIRIYCCVKYLAVVQILTARQYINECLAWKSF
jgi:hypothetical protein